MAAVEWSLATVATGTAMAALGMDMDIIGDTVAAGTLPSVPVSTAMTMAIMATAAVAAAGSGSVTWSPATRATNGGIMTA